MERIENQTFDMERALYGSHEISVKNCSFDGPADGESALKESSDINVEHCFCNLRYPFWHDHRLKITDSEMTPPVPGSSVVFRPYRNHRYKTSWHQGFKRMQRYYHERLPHCFTRVWLVRKESENGGLQCGKRIFHDAVSKSSVLQAENDRKVFFPIYRRRCI